MDLDYLVIGAHPDDAELGAGGFLHKMKQKGYTTGIVDLTMGEMGSRGTAEIRMEESMAGAQVLGVDVRKNLNLGDGHLEPNLKNRHILAKALRELKPSFIIAPYLSDKHPDHAAAGQIAKGAFYDARMSKLDLGLPPHSIMKIFYYPCHLYYAPSFVVDVTENFSAKMESVRAHKSQFDSGNPNPYEQYINIGISDYIYHFESRCRHFGSLINACYGEGFICEDVLPVDDPFSHFAGKKIEQCG